ncbi:DUF6090 family protein [Flagellimonas sp. GZD32]|uniref:DUF6090 family protein n=1 Tax=Flagellimonas cixiensis TaxID=3228750 RepID=UPI0035C901B4
MIKLFRRLRQNLLSEGKTGRYFKYAIGEILLVVIGILIAIQINDWKQQQTERELEKKYLKNLVAELQQDALGLTITLQQLKNQARTKNALLDMVRNNKAGDSIITYFDYQWRPIQPYIPLKSTYVEMTTNSDLQVIQDDFVREKIIKLYNAYESLEKEEDFTFGTATNNLLTLLSEGMPNMAHYSAENILALKDNHNLLNAIQLNGAYSRRDNYVEIIEECNALIQEIESYRQSLE